MEASPRLLVADEDPHTSALLALLLGAEGYRVDYAASLEDADARAAARGADLVVADGCCATREAFDDRAPAILAAAAGTPVVLLSALALDPADARARGFRDALPKPFDIDDLVARVRAALAPPEEA